MSDQLGNRHHPPSRISQSAVVAAPGKLLETARSQGAEFWADHARTMRWMNPWQRTLDWDFPRHAWFVGGETNISLNCFDRHLDVHGEAPALTALGEDDAERTFSYREALAQVCRIANMLKAAGVSKGDRVVIYMPLIAEGVFAMHACARIGAIHSVVYAGIGAGALRDRIEGCGAKALLYADGSTRRGQRVSLGDIVAEASSGFDDLMIFGLRRNDAALAKGHRDMREEMAIAPAWVDAEAMASSDPLFILYTSGTTGKPKGVVHGHGGYQVAIDWFSRNLFELEPGRGAWLSCSDIGWIVGHSYIAYGPFLAGAHQIIREGAPDWPAPDILWRIVDAYQVSGMFVSPTLLRMYMRAGPDCLQGSSRRSLRLMASAGEPLNGETLRWATENILADGPGQPPFGHVLDNFWQTEVASPVIATFPAMAAKASAAGLPMPTVNMRILTADGRDAEDGQAGALVMTGPLPHMMQDIWNDHDRYCKTWSSALGGYVTGDLAVRDADGYVSLLGRADDIITSAGHRLGTAEIESAIMGHPGVAECAVIGLPDALKGEVVKAFVVLKKGYADASAIPAAVQAKVRHDLGPIAQPSSVDVIAALPKTRSGKIMRRLLKSRAMGLPDGDLTTLDD